MDAADQIALERKARTGLDYNIIDADAHMAEPPELWQERVDKRFRDEAPRVVDEVNGQKGMYLVFEDVTVRFATSGKQGGSTTMQRPGGYDPAERLKDMEIDGVAAAVLYTTHGFYVFGTRKAELQTALFRAYNDWLAEFCAYAPDRYAGLGLVSLYDIEGGVRELERCARIGLKGAMIWGAPPDDKQPYSSPEYDRLWAAAEALNMPLALHTNTRPKKRDYYGAEQGRGKNFAPQYTTMVMNQAALQESVLQMTYGGVFERFPGLKMICAEGDIGWMPPLMQRADTYYNSAARRGHDLHMKMPPSEYIRRNVWMSFITDPIGLKLYPLGNLADRVMWSTDYPHPACFFPNSLEVFKRDFAGVPEADKKKIVHDNVAALFGFKNL